MLANEFVVFFFAAAGSGFTAFFSVLTGAVFTETAFALFFTAGFTAVLAVFAAALAVVSCKNQPKSEEEARSEKIEQFRAQLESDDTTTVLRLCDHAMDMLMNKQYVIRIVSLTCI